MALRDHAAEVRRAAHEAYSRSKRQTVTVAQTAYCASTLRARLADLLSPPVRAAGAVF